MTRKKKRAQSPRNRNGKRPLSPKKRELLHEVVDLLKTKDKAVLNFRMEALRESIRLARVYMHLKKSYGDRRVKLAAVGILLDGIALGTPATRSRLPEIYANYGYVYRPQNV